MSNRSGGTGRRWLRYLVYAAAATAFLVWGAGAWVVTEPAAESTATTLVGMTTPFGPLRCSRGLSNL